MVDLIRDGQMFLEKIQAAPLQWFSIAAWFRDGALD